MSNVTNFPKPSGIASNEKGVFETKASSLGRRNIGSIVEIADGEDLYIGKLSSLIRNKGITEIYLEGQPADEPLHLGSMHKVLVSQDNASVRGFTIGDKANHLALETLTVLQMATRDLAKTVVVNHAPKLVAV